MLPIYMIIVYCQHACWVWKLQKLEKSLFSRVEKRNIQYRYSLEFCVPHILWPIQFSRIVICNITLFLQNCLNIAGQTVIVYGPSLVFVGEGIMTLEITAAWLASELLSWPAHMLPLSPHTWQTSVRINISLFLFYL